MPDQSTVEILISIKAKQDELAAIKARLAELGPTAAAQKPPVDALRESWEAFEKEALAAEGFKAAEAWAAQAAKAEAQFAAEERAAATAAAQMERSVLGMVDGVIRVIPGAGQAGTALSQLGRGAIGASNSLGLVGTVALGIGVAGLVAFGVAMTTLVTKGIELQKQLQDVQEGIQATLVTDGNVGANEAQKTAAATIDLIRDAALRAQVPISQLSESFNQLFPAATRSGASIASQVALYSHLTANAGSLHLTQSQLIKDLEQIFNGQARNTNQLAQKLGLDKEQIQTTREHGSIIDLLTQKTNEYTSANVGEGDTIARTQQKLDAAFQQLADAAGKPLVQPLTTAMQDLTKTLNDPSISSGIGAIIENLLKLVGVAGTVILTMHNLSIAILDALGKAAQFFNQPIPGGDENGNGPGKPNAPFAPGLQAGGSDDDLTGALGLFKPPPKRDPVGGYPKEKGGGKGQSADTADAQELAAIRAQISAESERYAASVAQNDADHLLGLKSLTQEQQANNTAATQYLAVIQQQVDKLNAMRNQIIAVGDAQGGINAKEEKQLADIDKALQKANVDKAKLLLAQQSTTWTGQLQQGLIKFADSLQLTGAKAAQVFENVINTGIDGTASALTGLITGTKNWAQAFTQAGEQIIESLIKIMLQMIVGNVLSLALHSSEKSAAAGTAAAGAWSSAAQIPYVGWIIAPFAAAAAYAGAMAFEEGGMVPGRSFSGDNMMIRANSGEGVITAAGVSHLGGPSAIHSINNLNYHPPAFAFGGMVGGASSQGSTVAAAMSGGRALHLNNFIDMEAVTQHVLNHPSAQHVILSTVKKGRFRLAI